MLATYCTRDYFSKFQCIHDTWLLDKYTDPRESKSLLPIVLEIISVKLNVSMILNYWIVILMLLNLKAPYLLFLVYP